MSHSEFCGFKADQNGAFPIEAYYEFCEKHKIPFPLDWRPKGQQTGLYTIEQAVLKIMELSSDAQIYDKWVANIPKRVGFSFSPSLAATFNLTGFNGSDFGSGPRSPEESPEGATEGNTGPTAGAAVTGIVARCRHQLYSVGLVSSRSELPLSLMM